MAPETKKIVVHIVTGRLAGIRQIIGHLVIDEGDQFPPRIPNADLGDHVADVIHAGVYPRYVLYREAKHLSLGVLNEFNPSQV